MMVRLSLYAVSRAALAASVLVLSSTTALAGPPLICHPFDIGTARSLPIGPADGGWSALDPTYDRTKLVEDTLALLTPATPVIVRMETLRRAAIYASEDATLGDRLLKAVRARAASAPGTKPEALALFDAGYLIETYRQMSHRTPALVRLAGDTDGYSLVITAMTQHADDPAMQFAAALITAGPTKSPRHLAHLQKARTSAGKGSLVAKNVQTHFGA